MSDRTLRIVIAGDAAGAVKAAKDAEQQLGHLDVRLQATSARAVAVGVALGQVALQVGRSAVNGAQQIVQAASDVEESQNKVNVVFKASSRIVDEFAKNSAQAAGISKQAALESAAGFGNMFSTIGLAEQAGAEMSVRLVQLSADMASFNNQDPSEMLLKLKSGLAGEAEPLRAVGVLLSEARVKEEAYTSGIAARGAELDEAQKVQARYNLILKDSTVQQGDFARTSDGLANQQRILAAGWRDLQAQIGKELLPVFTEFVTETNNWIRDNGAQTARDLAGALKGVAETTKDIVRDVKALADFGPIKLGIDLVTSLSGEGLAISALGLLVATKVGGIPGLGIAGVSAGVGLMASGETGSRGGRGLILGGGALAGASAGATAGALAGAPLFGVGAIPGALLGGAIGGAAGLMGSSLWVGNKEMNPATAAIPTDLANRLRAAGITANPDDPNLVNIPRIAADIPRGGSGGGGGGGGAKDDPLVAAWKAIHAEMQREQVKALAEGGERQLAEVRGTQGEMIRATQEMAQRAHEAIGIDMADAVKAAFDFMRDQAKDSAKALEDYRDALKKTAEAEKALADQRREEANRLSAAFVTSGAFGGGAFAAAYGGITAGRADGRMTAEDIAAAIAAGNAATNARDTNAGKGSPATVAVTLSSDLAIAGEP